VHTGAESFLVISTQVPIVISDISTIVTPVATSISPSTERMRDGIKDANRQVNLRAQMQSYAQTTESSRLSQQLKKQLVLQRMKVAVYQADRAIANAESKYMMSKLAGKFSLISKIQQSMG
jgi:hypothetical protein